MTLEEAEVLVVKEFANRLYRPVVMAMVIFRSNELLLVQSAKALHEWGPPQGGIEADEHIFDALTRELHEETGIVAEYLSHPRLLWSEALDAPPHRRGERGFSRGKRYFAVAVSYAGPSALTLDPLEVAAYRWTPFGDVGNVMAQSRPERRALILRLLEGIAPL